VFGKDKNLLKQNAHDVYLAQFNWYALQYLSKFIYLLINLYIK
jgi:hypothetical protein